MTTDKAITVAKEPPEWDYTMMISTTHAHSKATRRHAKLPLYGDVPSRFKGKVALITGASSGVGRAIALALAAEGAHLWMVGRNAVALERVAQLAQSSTPHAHIIRADLAREEEIASLRRRLEHDTAGLDILIHSAGVIALGRLDEAPLQDFDWQYSTNLRGPYCLTQAVLPQLRAAQGQIAFINSTAGLKSRAGIAQYAATKFGLKALADALREEVNGDGIRVVSVFLGCTATPMQARMHHHEQKRYQPDRLVQPADVAGVVLNTLALARTAEVTEVTIRPFLAS